jgi:hypothetical protein
LACSRLLEGVCCANIAQSTKFRRAKRHFWQNFLFYRAFYPPVEGKKRRMFCIGKNGAKIDCCETRAEAGKKSIVNLPPERLRCVYFFALFFASYSLVCISL